MADPILEEISVVSELDAMGWTWEPAGGDGTEIRCKCPAHDDTNPSCGINIEKRVWKCQACKASGDFVSFMTLALKSSRVVVLDMLRTRYGVASPSKLIDPSAVERWHGDIWACGPMLLELRKRAVSDESIRKYRLGYDGRRVTIPVRDERGDIVNVRRYIPGAPGAEKMKNTRGCGQIRLYPIEQLQYDTVVVCGGEVKAIVAAERLNPHDIGAITATAGEGNWEAEFSRALRGKRVLVCFDVDREGVAASDVVAARTRADARWVGVIELDLDRDKYPKGDVNDYWGPAGRSTEDFLGLIESTPAWQPRVLREDPEASSESIEVTLAKSTDAEYVGKRLSVSSVVTSKDDAPYLVPRRVLCTCNRNAPFCVECPVYAESDDEKTGGVTLLINAESAAILSMVGSPKKAQREATREGLKIPPCKVVAFRTVEHYAIEDVRLAPQLNIADPGSSGGDVTRAAYFVGPSLELNGAYAIDGRVYPHPRDQHAVMLASAAVATSDSLSSFAPSVTDLEEMSVFKPNDWTIAGIQQKLDDLYADLEANVTRIYERRDLHLVIDLAFHSPLLVDFDGQSTKGWVEVLIAGDSGQGKSETTTRMMRHYSLGERVECKNASVAGLLGGLMQVGTKWFVQWGVIPRHDRRLVILEELKGASTDVIAKLTDMRSSGIAEIDKIEKRRTHARTRLIAVSNPRSDMSVAQHSFGIDAIKGLIGGLEDIRRFDMAYLVASEQVNPDVINRRRSDRQEVRVTHTAALCRRLVLWAWTRTAEQIEFSPETVDAVLACATDLCSRYTDSVPLVDRGTMRHKVARLASALACRTFSTANRDPLRCVVRPCHAEYVAKFLDDVYGSSVFGYRDYSTISRSATNLLDEEGLVKKLLALPFLRDFIESILAAETVDARDVCDLCGWEFEPARELISYLVRKHAIAREGTSYRKSSAFIALLKRLRDSDEVKKCARPDWIRDERTF